MGGLSSFFFGTPGKFTQQSTLNKGQQGLQQQQLASLQGPGAGGAFGQSADYYRSLLGNNSADLQAFQEPEMRRYNEQIIPELSEQFAGMGSGGLSSSGFRNAAVSAGTDLSERLASMRAGLRQSGADRLSSLAQGGLNNYSENFYQPRSPGLLEQLAPIAGQMLGSYVGGKATGNALGKIYEGSKGIVPAKIT